MSFNRTEMNRLLVTASPNACARLKFFVLFCSNLFFFYFLQATGTDRAAGYGMMLVSAFIFVYYTIWVVLLVSSFFCTTVLNLNFNTAHTFDAV